jgi:hypothetical protein
VALPDKKGYAASEQEVAMVWIGGAPLPSREVGRKEKQNAAPPVTQQNPQEPITCPRCNVQMQEGFLAGDNVELVEFEWVEPAPEYRYSTLYNLVRDAFAGRLRDKVHRMRAKAFRCPSCGCVESYARE